MYPISIPKKYSHHDDPHSSWQTPKFRGPFQETFRRTPNARGSVAPATATSDSEAMKVSQSLAQLAFVSPACRRLTFKGSR